MKKLIRNLIFISLYLCLYACSTMTNSTATKEKDNSLTVEVAKCNWKIWKLERWSNLSKDNDISRKHLIFNLFLEKYKTKD